MTKMQEFTMKLLSENRDNGVSGKFVGARWREQNGGHHKVASRSTFGSTSAGYRALRTIAGCVHGQQDARWDKDKRGYMAQGCEVDIIPVEDFKFGKCQCENQKTKMRFKVLAQYEL